MLTLFTYCLNEYFEHAIKSFKLYFWGPFYSYCDCRAAVIARTRLIVALCVALRRAYVLRNESLGDFVVVRTSYSVLTQTQAVQYSLLHT